MSKTKHVRKKTKVMAAWAVTQDGKVVLSGGLNIFKIYDRKQNAQQNCWMGGQEVQRVSVRVIGSPKG